jgi:hypothetical protein
MYNILLEKPDEKKSIGRQRHLWEDKIKTHLKNTGWDWIRVAVGRLM